MVKLRHERATTFLAIFTLRCGLSVSIPLLAEALINWVLISDAVVADCSADPVDFDDQEFIRLRVTQ